MNPPIDLWVLTCAPASRIVETISLIEGLGQQTVVVTTLPDPIPSDFLGDDVTVLLFESEEINISKWWTLGFEYIAAQYADDPDAKWDVLLVETDVTIPIETVERMRRVMRDQEVVLAGLDFYNVMPEKPIHVRRDNSVWRPEGRCIGMAQMFAGEAGLRHDPEFRWWLADDDIEWYAREHGGTVLISGLPVHHVGTQGPLTGDRLIAWNEDQVKFSRTWGALPAQGGIPS